MFRREKDNTAEQQQQQQQKYGKSFNCGRDVKVLIRRIKYGHDQHCCHLISFRFYSQLHSSSQFPYARNLQTTPLIILSLSQSALY